MKNYITLPSDFRNSDICIDLLMSEGAAGYGVFIMLLEVLRECDGYKIKDDAARLNFSLRLGDVELVKRVLHNYQLFEQCGEGYLMCPVFSESMSGYEKKRAQKQAAGRARHTTPEKSAEPSAEVQQNRSRTAAEVQQNISTTPPYSIVQNSTKEVNTSQSTEKSAPGGMLIYTFGGVCRISSDTLKAVEREQCVGASPDVLEKLYTRANGRWLSNVAAFFHLTDNQINLLWLISDKGNMEHQNTKDILAAMKSAKTMNAPVKYPVSYILSKIHSYK